MDHVLRTHTLSEPRGFMKALVDQSTDRILGFTAFGVGAGEVMAVVQVAMRAELPYTLIGDMVLTHPTIAEGLNEFASVRSKSSLSASPRGAVVPFTSISTTGPVSSSPVSLNPVTPASGSPTPGPDGRAACPAGMEVPSPVAPANKTPMP